MASIKYILKIILRIFTRIFFIFPVKDGRILFLSFEGEKVSGNPKNIYDFLVKHNPEIKDYIWIFNGIQESIDLPNTIKVVKRRSLKRLYFLATAQIVVDNYPPSMMVPSRKKQLYIETWHAGGAYKKIGNAYQAKKKAETKVTDLAMRTVKVFVSSSRVFTETNIEKGYHYRGEILNCGMPRNDIFFDSNLIKNASDKVKRYYSLKGPVVLYAPTFRGEVAHADEISIKPDMEKLRAALKIRYCSNACILVRCHYLDKHDYNFGDNVINAGNYPDMQELLCATDILITDYSSSMWDFALLGRPCLLYTPDIDKYIKNRGVFTLPDQWPGIICRDMDGLCNEIINLNEKACAERAKKHLNVMGSYETGHATEIIANRIVDFINGDWI